MFGNPRELEQGRNNEFERRVTSILDEYPLFRPIVQGLTSMRATEQEWIEAAQEVQKGPDEETLAQMRGIDPDFLSKYKFVLAAAMIDNATIPEHVRNDLIAIVYGTMIPGTAVEVKPSPSE